MKRREKLSWALFSVLFLSLLQYNVWAEEIEPQQPEDVIVETDEQTPVVPVEEEPIPQESAPQDSLEEESLLRVSSQPEVSETNEELWSQDWKFHYGEVQNGQAVTLDDSGWRDVDVPHDFSSELDFVNTNQTEAESGYLPGGTAWYRKHFILDEADRDKVIQVHFDGVYMNSTVYINGKKLGSHPYGYTSFSFDLSKYLYFDGITENILAVHVDHSQLSSRWYSGSGIYRNVYLSKQEQVYIPKWSMVVTTPNLEQQKDGTVQTHIQTKVKNESNEVKSIVVVQTLFDSLYQQVSQQEDHLRLDPNSSVDFEQILSSKGLQLWSPDNPVLYQLRTDIIEAGVVIDTKWNEIGFRYFRFDPDTGFYLNGESLKLQGVCLHSDLGPLGSAVNESALRRELQLMKDMGVNAIRATHNPASTEFLHLCNVMGFIVIEEFADTWTMTKDANTYDYGHWFATAIEADNEIIYKEGCNNWVDYDIRQMVRHSVNAPCVIMYSLGNELSTGITNTYGRNNYPRHARYMVGAVLAFNTDHLVTIGDNSFNRGGQETEENLNYMVDQVIMDEGGGVLGLNYAKEDRILTLHQNHPDWPIYMSEVASTVTTRDYYKTNGRSEADKQTTAYGTDTPSWGSTAWNVWDMVIRNDFLAGEFIWTGVDYIGEPTPWNKTTSSKGVGDPYPKSSYFGVVDLAGFEKDLYYFYQSQWRKDGTTTLHVSPYWSDDLVAKDANGNIKVVVYSNASSVELFINGRSLGRQTFEKYMTPNGKTYQKVGDQYFMTWSVPYEDGAVWAVAYDENGNVISNTLGRSRVETAGPAVTIRLTPEETIQQADGTSLIYVVAEAVDENGIVDPHATHWVDFSTEGYGTVIATENGDPTDITNMKSTRRHLFFGKAIAIIRVGNQTGELVIHATADGLNAGNTAVTLTEVQPDERPVNTEYPKKLEDWMIRLEKETYDYNGDVITPNIIIEDSSLSADDYTVQNGSGKEAGTYTMILTGVGNFYGTIQKTFTIVDTTLNGFVTSNGKTYYYIDNVRQKGQMKISGYWYMFELVDGVMQTGWFNHTKETNPPGAKRVYYDNKGHMLFGWQTIDKKTYYLAPSDGALQYGYIKVGNNWYWLNEKTGVREYTGVVKNPKDGKWYFVRNGIGEKFTGVSKSIANGQWYHTKDGILDWNFIGFSKSVSNGKWYVSYKGKLNWNYTGVAKSIANGQWYHAKNGCLDWGFTGFSKSYLNQKWYFSRNGKLDWNFTGVAKSIENGKWYFARKGALDWNYNGGAISVQNGKWYAVQNGRLNWNYNGVLPCVDGKQRTFRNGVAV